MVALDCLFIAAGGAIGSVLRYLCTLIPFKQEIAFPIATFAVNLIGSFLMGFICAAALSQTGLSKHTQLFLRVGLCGGFTTFSTFAAENANLISQGNYVLAGIYIVLSITLGVAGYLAGEALSTRLLA